MSFGYGVDIMAISGLALKVYTAYKDAPGDYRNISDEVESLHIIINKAAKHFESTTLSDNSRQEGQKVLKGCKNVLEDLDTLMEKYNSLASTSTSTGTSQVLQRFKLGASQVLGTEDIATLRARLTSNTTLLNGFIQSCDSDKIQAQLDSVLGLRRTMSKDSIVSFAGSINTKKAYKKFCKGLFEIGVTADIIKQKEKEIQDLLKSQLGDSTFVDPNQLPVVGSSSDQGQFLEVGKSSNSGTSPISTMSTENPRSRFRFGRVRLPIDFLVGPLMLAAAETGDIKRVVSTLAYVWNINFADDRKETALYKAATKGHKDTVQLLLSKGASTEAMGKYDMTPLHEATWFGHTSTVELLLSKGASIEAKCERKRTPLHYAAWDGHPSTVELLLSKGASIEAICERKRTPLHYAAWDGHPSTMELLLSKGASIEAMCESKRTPLHYAASGGRTSTPFGGLYNQTTSTVELLLSKGASIEAMCESKRTPLHYAAWGGHTSTVALILSKGASIEATDESNRTPLHYAAWYGRTSTVELLLSKGASIEARCESKRTPLHYATWHGQLSTVELLLSKGASTEAIDFSNMTPLDLATNYGYPITAKLLKQNLPNLLAPETYEPYLNSGGSDT